MPHLCGFFGMYCIHDSLPLKAIILSSIEMFMFGVYAAMKFFITRSRIGLIL